MNKFAKFWDYVYFFTSKIFKHGPINLNYVSTKFHDHRCNVAILRGKKTKSPVMRLRGLKTILKEATSLVNAVSKAAQVLRVHGLYTIWDKGLTPPQDAGVCAEKR